jgi:trans-aconitate methyltransferase
MNQSLAVTSKEFWENYWKNFRPFLVENAIPFKSLLKLFPQGQKNFIEIGGFPGTFSIYFKKFFNYDSTLLDYMTGSTVIHQLEKANNLPINAINVITTDFLTYDSQKKYDVVFSWGFIEHFKETAFILKKHISLLNSGGTLMVGLPNFLGLNGLIQKILDPQNLSAHHLPAMNVQLLKQIASEANLKEYRVFYYGKPCLWLEPTAQVSSFKKILVLKVLFLLELQRFFLFF